MADTRQSKLYETQKSLTEWLEDIKHKDTNTIRQEDNDKRERLKVLKNLIGLPFDEPVKFEATDLRDKTSKYQEYLKDHGNDLCALRLIPKDSSLPKLRMRGKSVADVYAWFLDQKINADKYRAEYVPHADNYEWSTIIIVNKHGFQGEIIRGGHYQLTQGFFDSGEPIVFRYDFKTWNLSKDDPEALAHIKHIAKLLRVKNAKIRQQIQEKLGGEFAHDYLLGYFETTSSKEGGLWVVDYNQSIGKMYDDMVFRTTKTRAVVSGQTGCAGTAKGKAVIVDPDNIDVEFPTGAILVCNVTTPDFVPLMKKAAAIVTDQGGILSHAAIVARELKVPCIVGTGNATKVLKLGQQLFVDASNGVVTQI